MNGITYPSEVAASTGLTVVEIYGMIKRGEIKAEKKLRSARGGKRTMGQPYIWQIPWSEVGRIQDMMTKDKEEIITLPNGWEFRNDLMGSECKHPCAVLERDI